MTTKFTLEEIRNYWTRQASDHGQSSAASWSDTRVIDMEIREISSRLADGERVLDIGCANGYSTTQYACAKKISIRGLDYIPEMIAKADARLVDIGDRLSGTVEFATGDITDLKEPAGEYDKVIVTRVVINLGSWEKQLKALYECCRVLKPGGTLLLSEATLQGWQALNRFRTEWGLPDIPMPSFNSYLDEQEVLTAIEEKMALVEVVNFSSTYYLGTRLFKPLLAKALGGDINVADPNMEWNRLFSQLPSWGNYGTQKLFVFRKR